MTITTNEQVEHARRLAERFSIFPLDHPSHRYCQGVGNECRKRRDRGEKCERGKHPTCEWSSYSTADPDKLAQGNYFGGPARNYAIDCGKSGVLVIDEDAPGEFDRVCSDFGVEVPRTFTVRTAKGRHFYFQQPGELGNREAALRAYDVNVRGVGGYVVAPGSLHSSGAMYEVIDDSPIEDCPGWLVDALTGAAAAPAMQGGGVECHPEPSEWWRDGPIKDGNRHAAIVAAAGWCRRLGMARDDAKIVVREVLSRCEGDRYTLGDALEKLDDVYGRYPAGTVLEERRHDAELVNGFIAPARDTVATSAASTTTWEPIDLRAALAGERPPPPTIWHHKRGHALLYAGRTHVLAGESESLKSWALQAAAVEVLGGGGDVLYLDYEDDELGVVERLLALGAKPDDVLEHLVYLRPDEPTRTRSGEYTPGGLRYEELLVERQWRLVILDGTTEAMTTEGMDPDRGNADAATFNRRFLKRAAATGAAAVAIDHVVKNAEGGRYALGAGHKLAGLTGAQFVFKPQRPLRRALTDQPEVGIVKVSVTKDRPGWIRGRGDEVGLWRITAWPDGKVDAEMIDAADLGDDGADMRLAGEILSYLDTYNGASKNQLEEGLTGKRDGIRAAVTWMIGKNWIRVEKEGQAHRHYLTDEGRAEVPT